VITSRGKRNPANADDTPDEVTFPSLLEHRSTNATQPVDEPARIGVLGLQRSAVEGDEPGCPRGLGGVRGGAVAVGVATDRIITDVSDRDRRRGGALQLNQTTRRHRKCPTAALDRSVCLHDRPRAKSDSPAEFVDEGRPRRVSQAGFDLVLRDGSSVRIEAEAQGSAIAMQGLGYGGYNDGLGLGVWRGINHLEHDSWDVSKPAIVGYPDGTTGRPVHRIQPVRVTHRTSLGGVSAGTGSLTFIAELPLASGERRCQLLRVDRQA
jgi:hypothetical protein